jgi:hypothetical protein
MEAHYSKQTETAPKLAWSAIGVVAPRRYRV